MLKLWAWDGVSGVDQMRVGADPALADASWQPYGAALAWEGGGSVAYAQYSDTAGNISRIFSSDEGLCPAERVYLPVVLDNAAAPACVDAVANGGFETDSDWVLPSTPYEARYSTAQAHSGDRSMQVGIVDAAEDVESYSSAQQEVTIPAGVGSATLRFWLYAVSDEPELRTSVAAPALEPQDTLAADGQYVLLFDESGARKTLLSAVLDVRSWVEYGSFDLSDYKGQTVKLYFGVSNDGDGEPTGMYVDDVSLEICPP